MAEKSRLKVTIINRYYPPSKSVTGESAYELSQYLNKNDEIEVISVSIAVKYKGSKINFENTDKNYFLRALYSGNNKILRFVFNFLEGYKLAMKAISLKSDVIITLTDPPLINFWAALLFKKNIRWFNWTMDLYPNAFVSAGLISTSNLFFKYINTIIKKRKPNLTIALGQMQKEFLIKEYYGNESKYVLLPCGIHEVAKSTHKPIWLKEEKIIFAYAGNLGEAHSDTFLLNFINCLDSEKHHLVLSVYGSKSQSIINVAKNTNKVTIVESLNKEDFEYIDIHLVSLLPEWTNVCVPSKAVSAICANSTILFYGSEKADTLIMLKEACFFLPYQAVDYEELKSINTFLLNLTKDNIIEKRINAGLISTRFLALKEETFKTINHCILT